MATPRIMAITYDGDANRADIEAFFPQYAASPAWAMQVAEYGIGDLKVLTPRHVAGPAATSDSAIRQLLTTNLSGSTPAWGVPNENTVYSITLPVGTQFTDNHHQPCRGAYHDDFLIGSVDVAYAIQCPSGNDFPPPVTPLQELTFDLSHELVEAVTDPRYEHDYAWGDVDEAHEVWAYITDGELADLCEFVDTAFWTDPPGMTYAITRIWSNTAALAGMDPCVGAPMSTYYQTVPDQPDGTTISLFGFDAPTKAKKIAMGASDTITLHVAGTAGTGPFTINVYDVASRFFGSSVLLNFTQPTGTFQIGDTIKIPVTTMGKDGGLGGVGAESFVVVTKPMNGGPTTYFYGLVAQ
jgi:hypothetical protein